MNANGARTESNNFLIDSSTVSSSQRSGVVNINPNAESVEEVRVLGEQLLRGVRPQRLGARQRHHQERRQRLPRQRGAYYTNDDLQAKNHFQKQRPTPDFSRKEFSWGLGGPIRRTTRSSSCRATCCAPDVAISGTDDHHARVHPVHAAEPARTTSRRASPNAFPASFTPDRNFRTAGQLLDASCSGSTPIDSPIGPIPCNLPVTGVGTWNETSPRNGLQWTARVDHTLQRRADRLYGSFNRTTTDKVGFGEPRSIRRSPRRRRPAACTSTRTTPRSCRRRWSTRCRSRGCARGASSPTRTPTVPGITVGGLTGYQVGWGPNEFVQNSFDWRDVVTWTRGSHSMKVGAAYTREHADNDSSRTYNRPTYDFNNVFDFADDSPRRQAQIAIDPRTGGARARADALPPHAVGLRVRAGRLEGETEPDPERRAALRGVPEHLRRVGRHGQHRVRERRRSPHAAAARTGRRAALLPRGRPVERRAAHARAARELRVGSRQRRPDVDPRRRRALLRAHVEPDLGLRAPQPARLRDRDALWPAIRRCGRSSALAGIPRCRTTIHVRRA